MTDPFDEALAAATEQWMGKDGIVAVGQGGDADAPTIEVWTTTSAAAPDLPERFRGYPVRAHDAGGPIQAEDVEGRFRG